MYNQSPSRYHVLLQVLSNPRSRNTVNYVLRLTHISHRSIRHCRCCCRYIIRLAWVCFNHNEGSSSRRYIISCRLRARGLSPRRAVQLREEPGGSTDPRTQILVGWFFLDFSRQPIICRHTSAVGLGVHSDDAGKPVAKGERGCGRFINAGEEPLEIGEHSSKRRGHFLCEIFCFRPPPSFQIFVSGPPLVPLSW
ncbi:hypothetical protein BDM02DRAFT_860772 [Thelephora ganbajun]|uniref:Uncharacterized protein n=1 Tax=Thelephora ganbajun TaxID=370292 RepID=A0ACB6ZPM4_THEGA|nr:hypothetical protein BDM02DRAFT_860772 [Thelephora ganbajun]